MKKATWILGLVALTVLVYLIMPALMAAINPIVDISVESMNSTSNMTNYPGMIGATESMPLIMWFVPGVICAVLSVLILKYK